jgi:hypothetical protein
LYGFLPRAFSSARPFGLFFSRFMMTLFIAAPLV